MMILKIGGGAGINITGIIEGLGAIDEPTVIVHGANALRDELAEKLNVTKSVVTSVKGYSSVLSDESIIDLQMMAYAGLRNKRIVELCQCSSLRSAIGAPSLADKSRGIRCREQIQQPFCRPPWTKLRPVH